jgi:integrase
VCDAHLQPIVITALHTGMRRGDKTKNGDRRELPANATLKFTLSSINRRLDMPYVFYNIVTDKPYQSVKRSSNTELKRAGIKDFHFYDLRHTFASHLVMAGIDITTVKALLRHKILTMTLRYAHLAPSHKVKAIDVLDNTLNGRPTKQNYTVQKKRT